MDRRSAPPATEISVTAADGVRLSVRAWEGAGSTPFLLVHGLASNARLWDGVAGRLAALGHAVAAPDQRGHGRSDKPDHGYDHPTLTADLVAVVDHLGLDHPVVAGQSWGANLAVELAVRQPDRVRGVACVDGGVVDLARHLSDWESCLAELGPPGLPGLTLDELEADVRSQHPDWPDEGVDGALACYEPGPDGAVPRLSTEHHLAILAQLWQHRPSELFSRLEVPVLLVMCDGGGGGWLLEAKRHAAAAARMAAASSRLEWFEADHDVHAQRPADVAELLHGAVEDGFFS